MTVTTLQLLQVTQVCFFGDYRTAIQKKCHVERVVVG